MLSRGSSTKRSTKRQTSASWSSKWRPITFRLGGGSGGGPFEKPPTLPLTPPPMGRSLERWDPPPWRDNAEWRSKAVIAEVRSPPPNEKRSCRSLWCLASISLRRVWASEARSVGSKGRRESSMSAKTVWRKEGARLRRKDPGSTACSGVAVWFRLLSCSMRCCWRTYH